MTTELERMDEETMDQLPPIKQDAIAEEVFAARSYAKRLTRTVVAGQSILLVLFGLCIYGLAVRPPKRIYIKLDDMGRATPIQYADLEHYTPDAAVAKNYLSDWANFRYGMLRASVLKTFPQNYLFLDSRYGAQIRDQDMKKNIVANVLAGRQPENEVVILSTNLTSFGKRSVGSSVVATGTAEIALRKTFKGEDGPRTQTWIIAVRFFLNPEQVSTQSADHPEYQTINPLGLTIVEFQENRTNVEASAKQ